tara:strand:+ start:3157 stop:3405 length:249 start_codon:yes stop_codon:yes gene_type:complete
MIVSCIANYFIETRLSLNRKVVGWFGQYGKSKKTSRYGKSSVNRRFLLGSAESMLPNSSHVDDQTSQHKLIVFGRFVMIVRT